MAQADIIRLLLLTRCRRNEIVRLRWSEVGDDTLVLCDSKPGPRKVPSARLQSTSSNASRAAGALSCFRPRATRTSA